MQLLLRHGASANAFTGLHPDEQMAGKLDPEGKWVRELRSFVRFSLLLASLFAQV